MNALHKMYVEVDGKQYTDWTRQFTYRGLLPVTEDGGSTRCAIPSPSGRGSGSQRRIVWKRYKDISEVMSSTILRR